MKRLILVVLAAAGFDFAPVLHAQTTCFTYQGSLNQGSAKAHGSFDMEFSLFDAPSNGVAIAGPLLLTVAVSDGSFRVPLDFGSGPFNGQDLWLQIAVRTNGVGVYVALNPRQALTSTPYAIRAREALVALTAASAGTATGVAVNGVNNAALQNNTVTANNGSEHGRQPLRGGGQRGRRLFQRCQWRHAGRVQPRRGRSQLWITLWLAEW